MIAKSGLPAGIFDDPENIIPFAALADLLDHCAAATHCDHVGLLVGARAGASALGRLGFIALNSPNVGSALGSLVKYLGTVDRCGIACLRVDKGLAFFFYISRFPSLAGADQIADGAIAVGFNILRTLRGPDWCPTEALLARRRPDVTEPFQRFFCAPLRFNAEEHALVFPPKWLNHRMSAVEPQLRRLC